MTTTTRHVFRPVVVRGVWFDECRRCAALRRLGFLVGRGGATVALKLFRAPSSVAWTTEIPSCRL